MLLCPGKWILELNDGKRCHACELPHVQRLCRTWGVMILKESGTLRMVGVLGAFYHSCCVAPKRPPEISQAPPLKGTGLAGVALKTRFSSAAGVPGLLGSAAEGGKPWLAGPPQGACAGGGSAPSEPVTWREAECRVGLLQGWPHWLLLLNTSFSRSRTAASRAQTPPGGDVSTGCLVPLQVEGGPLGPLPSFFLIAEPACRTRVFPASDDFISKAFSPKCPTQVFLTVNLRV